MWLCRKVLLVTLWYTSHCGEAILASGGSATDVKKHSNLTDNFVSQESIQRSSVYGGYYPDDLSEAGHHYGYSHHDSYHPQHYHQHEPYNHHHPVSYDHNHHGAGINALLIPLAGVALLGAAALFASNPVLLQLGVVSGKRRRRGVTREGWDLSDRPLEKMLLLKGFMEQMPKKYVEQQERKLLANYLKCSESDPLLCVERLACELYSKTAADLEMEKQIMDMVIQQIMKNEYIDERVKKAIIKAKSIGYLGEDCSSFACPELDKKI